MTRIEIKSSCEDFHGAGVPPSGHGAVVPLLPTTLGPQDSRGILLCPLVVSAPLNPENTGVSNAAGASGAVPVVSHVGQERWPLLSAALPALLTVPLSLLLSVSTHCSVSHLRVLFFFLVFFHPTLLCPVCGGKGSHGLRCWGSDGRKG